MSKKHELSENYKFLLLKPENRSSKGSYCKSNYKSSFSYRRENVYHGHFNHSRRSPSRVNFFSSRKNFMHSSRSKIHPFINNKRGFPYKNYQRNLTPKQFVNGIQVSSHRPVFVKGKEIVAGRLISPIRKTTHSLPYAISPVRNNSSEKKDFDEVDLIKETRSNEKYDESYRHRELWDNLSTKDKKSNKSDSKQKSETEDISLEDIECIDTFEDEDNANYSGVIKNVNDEKMHYKSSSRLNDECKSNFSSSQVQKRSHKDDIEKRSIKKNRSENCTVYDKKRSKRSDSTIKDSKCFKNHDAVEESSLSINNANKINLNNKSLHQKKSKKQMDDEVDGEDEEAFDLQFVEDNVDVEAMVKAANTSVDLNLESNFDDLDEEELTTNVDQIEDLTAIDSTDEIIFKGMIPALQNIAFFPNLVLKQKKEFLLHCKQFFSSHTKEICSKFLLLKFLPILLKSLISVFIKQSNLLKLRNNFKEEGNKKLLEILKYLELNKKKKDLNDYEKNDNKTKVEKSILSKIDSNNKQNNFEKFNSQNQIPTLTEMCLTQFIHLILQALLEP